MTSKGAGFVQGNVDKTMLAMNVSVGTTIQNRFLGSMEAAMRDLASLSPEQRQKFDEAKVLPATHKINHGQLDELHLNDIKTFFALLDLDNSGGLESAELALFCHDIMDPPCPEKAVTEIYQLAQDCSGGKITPEYFHSALTTGPLRRMIHDNDRHAELKDRFSSEHQAPITREFMAERFEWRANRDDSFRTLPLVLVYMTIFVSLVIGHLRIWQ